MIFRIAQRRGHAHSIRIEDPLIPRARRFSFPDAVRESLGRLDYIRDR